VSTCDYTVAEFGWQMSRKRAWLAAMAPLALSLAVVGCGVPTDSQPRDVAEPDRPFVIHQPGAAADEGTSTLDPVIYFLAPRPDERVVAAHRPIPNQPDQLMAALFGKLNQDEMQKNWRSALPTNVVFVGTTRDKDGTITVKLTAPKDAPSFLSGEDGVRAAAQLVYTLSEVDGVSGVAVELNGEKQKLLDEDGTVLTRPATKPDYRSYDPLAPVVAPSTTSN
jgi:spore germination protein GerM